MDITMVELAGVVLALVHVMRRSDELRDISLRRASNQERTLYAKNYHQAHWHRLGSGQA
jgi:uncharacterized DUF497 family protein